jgi:hypothetical protein
MFSKKRLFVTLIGLLLMYSVISFSVYFYNNGKYQNSLSLNNELTVENDDLKSRISQLQDKLDINTRELSTLKQQLSDKQKELDNAPKLSQYFISLYKSKNLSDPQKNITEDLMKRTDLIPQKAVLGGAMKIENVALLSPDYAYATYSDGHILGHMILKFYVSKEGKIDWQLIKYSTY